MICLQIGAPPNFFRRGKYFKSIAKCFKNEILPFEREIPPEYRRSWKDRFIEKLLFPIVPSDRSRLEKFIQLLDSMIQYSPTRSLASELLNNDLFKQDLRFKFKISGRMYSPQDEIFLYDQREFENLEIDFPKCYFKTNLVSRVIDSCTHLIAPSGQLACIVLLVRGGDNNKQSLPMHLKDRSIIHFQFWNDGSVLISLE